MKWVYNEISFNSKPSDKENPMKHKNIFGRIAYTSKKPDLMDQPRGHETFHITKHRDGQVTLRAHCEIEEPHPTVMRDVILTTDQNNRPMDCFIRLTVDDQFMGSGWFRFDLDDNGKGIIECESYGPSIDRITQRQETNGSFHSFGTHPIVGDGFNCKSIDISNVPVTEDMRCFMPSLDHRGATPPMIAELTIGCQYHGKEEIAVNAGTFLCHHFSYIDDVGFNEGIKHPPYDIWLTEEDFIIVQAGVSGYMQTWYELIELRYD